MNSAPSISGTLALGSVNEDTVYGGIRLSTLLAATDYADADAGGTRGVALTSLRGSGLWQYSLDNENWISLGKVSDATALLLDESAYLRFVPAANASGAAGFSLRAWDGTAGAPSGSLPSYFNVTASGGSEAFSAEVFSAELTVAPGNDAPSFRGGTPFVAFAPMGDGVYPQAIAVQPDGGILVGGFGDTYSSYNFALARFDPAGALDSGFGGGGQVTTATVGRLAEVQILPDGKIVAAGGGYSYGSYSGLNVVRYQPDGSLDTTFAGDGIASYSYGDSSNVDMVVQGDGKVVVIGTGAMARFNTDGSLDTGFANGVPTQFPWATAAALQSDGKILVGGVIFGANYGIPQYGLSRFNQDGSIDTGFGNGGMVKSSYGSATDPRCWDIAVQSDGKIIVAGRANATTNADYALARYNTDGSLDTAFGSGGFVTRDAGDSEDGRKVYIQPDGKILLLGMLYDYSRGWYGDLVRFNSDGSPDTGFHFANDPEKIRLGESYGLTMDAQGKILVSGYGTNAGGDPGFVLVRLNQDGSLDQTLNPASTVNASPRYAENGAPVILDGSVSVHDPELGLAGNYAGMTLTLARHGGARIEDRFAATGNVSALVAGSELKLAGVDVGTVTRNSGGTLVLAFDGMVSHTQVGQVLSSIAYSNSSNAPAASIQIDWTLSDGNTGSQGSGGPLAATGKTVVAVTRTNDAPVLTVGGQGQFVTGHGPVALDPRAQVLDAELAAAGNYGGATLTLSREGGARSEDVFSALGNLGPLGQSAPLTLGGVNIGTVTRNSGGLLQLTFGANATQARVNEALGSIAYSTGADALSGVKRFSWRLADGNLGAQGTGGNLAGTDTSEVQVTGTNHAPRFTATAGYSPTNVKSLFGAGAHVFDAELAAADNYGGSSFGLVRHGAASASDIYVGTGSLGPLTHGGELTLAGVVIGQVTSNRGGVLSLEFNGSATQARIDGCLRLIAYANSGNPPPASVQLDWTFNDGNAGAQGLGGALSASGTITVANTVANTAPRLALSAATAYFQESAPGIVLAPDARVEDRELALLGKYAGASVTLGRHGGAVGEDIFLSSGSLGPLAEGESLSLAGIEIGMVSRNSGGLLTLSFNANATGERVNQTLSQIAYLNSSGAPPSSVQIDWVFRDGNGGLQGSGGALADTQASTVTIGGSPSAAMTVYHAPTVAAIVGTPTIYTSSRVQIVGGSVTVNFYGRDFSYSEYGEVTGGIVTGTDMSNSANGGLQYRISGLSHSAVSIYDFVTQGDSEGLSEFMFNGNDVVTGSAAAELVRGYGGCDTLNGGGGNDTLYGIGDGQGDRLAGGTGNDRYYVGSGNALDFVVEAPDAGTDTIISEGSYVLPVNVEHLVLTSPGRGTGNGLANRIQGSSGADFLDGKAGADSMIGGYGNDSYVVDNPGDVITEGSGGGRDTVQSLISLSLGAQVENLVLLGTAALSATGNAYANVLTGNPGANVLDGGSGADTLCGGAGNDTYLVDNAGDRVFETLNPISSINAGGADLVKSSISFTLGAYVEKLALTGTGAINGLGNGLANVIAGNGAGNRLEGGAGADTLAGGGGSDTLLGGAGQDVLTGGTGADKFLIAAPPAADNRDAITDFLPGTDRILVDDDFFPSLGIAGTATGVALTETGFRLGATAQGSLDRIIYDPATGILYFDEDGSGTGAAQQIALIGTTTHPQLSAADFLVVA